MSHDKTSNRIKMRVMGISYNKIHNDAYALILAQENGPYRIPVIIGSAEAQAIAIKMENIIPPRPLTHDLFVSFTHAFGVTLRDVFIYKFESGIFYSELTFSDGDREVVLDSRTSDAISIAIRTDTPIYTTTDILTEAGFIMEDEQDNEKIQSETLEDDDFGHESNRFEPKLENLAIEELEKRLARLIEEENYEEAANISKILNNKRNSSKK